MENATIPRFRLARIVQRKESKQARERSWVGTDDPHPPVMFPLFPYQLIILGDRAMPRKQKSKPEDHDKLLY